MTPVSKLAQGIAGAKTTAEMLELTEAFRKDVANRSRGTVVGSVGIYLAWCDGIVFAATVIGNQGCMCQGCGKTYREDVRVPDDVWEQIKPDGKPVGGGLLCGQCIVKRMTTP